MDLSLGAFTGVAPWASLRRVQTFMLMTVVGEFGDFGLVEMRGGLVVDASEAGGIADGERIAVCSAACSAASNRPLSHQLARLSTLAGWIPMVRLVSACRVRQYEQL